MGGVAASLLANGKHCTITYRLTQVIFPDKQHLPLSKDLIIAIQFLCSLKQTVKNII